MTGPALDPAQQANVDRLIARRVARALDKRDRKLRQILCPTCRAALTARDVPGLKRRDGGS